MARCEPGFWWRDMSLAGVGISSVVASPCALFSDLQQRPPIHRPLSSRSFVDQALSELVQSRWSAGGWARFLWRSSVRSAEQAAAHPRAFSELTLLGVLLACAGHRRAALLTWVMGITHLGLLGEQDRFLGWPNRLSLLRANLPALLPERFPLQAPVALATDFFDGFLARRGSETAFGAYADGLADITFWTWFVSKREPSLSLRAVALGLWGLPAAVITFAYFKGGRSLDYPRPAAFRYLSVGCQLLVAARALARNWGERPPAVASSRTARIYQLTTQTVGAT